MLDFGKLKLVVNEKYSFVGIEKRNNEFLFHLPKGMNSCLSKIDSYYSKKDMFFLLYRILGVFKNTYLEKNHQNKKVSNRDGVIFFSNGSSFNDEYEKGSIFYSKLASVDKVIDAFDELRILALVHRLEKTEGLDDISKVHKHLHQATYLSNHAVYIDQAIRPKFIINFSATDIISIYCFIYCEIKDQLQELVNPEIRVLATKFKEIYLAPEDGIFDELNFERTFEALKDSLEYIDHHTPLKDSDYWIYFDAVYQFLYESWNNHENGFIWGINNFYSVWESICLSYLVKKYNKSRILYLDTQFIKKSLVEDWLNESKQIVLSTNTFQLKSNNYPLKPDAILLNSIDNEIKFEGNYEISPKDWDDFGYFTKILGLGIKDVSICLAGQEQHSHTISYLREIYPEKYKYSKKLIMNKPLEGEFYSFWKMPDKTQEIDHDYLCKMKFFNHLFYLSIKKNIFNWHQFKKEILNPIGIHFCVHSTSLDTNVFTHSLCRDYCVITVGESVSEHEKEKKMELQFNKFHYAIQRNFPACQSIEIIDIKYLTPDYFLSGNNRQEIKDRSLRKQFVYEYLLQKELNNKSSLHSGFNIQSSFWLPYADLDGTEVLSSTSSFLDDYIFLKNANFFLMVDSYLSQ